MGMLIGGLTALVAGVALLSLPAAFIVGGAALVALALSEALGDELDARLVRRRAKGT